MQSVWNKTLLNEFYVPPTKFVYNLDDPSQITGKERYFVFNHENLKAAKEIIFKHLKGKRVNIILDECHGFTDMKTDRVQYLIEICKFLTCKDVLFMSGTPFKALGAEVIPFFGVLTLILMKRTRDGSRKFLVSTAPELFIS